MKIAIQSSSTASKVKGAIEKEFRAKYPINFMLSHCVQIKYTIKHFESDIEFLKGLAISRLEDPNDISKYLCSSR